MTMLTACNVGESVYGPVVCSARFANGTDPSGKVWSAFDEVYLGDKFGGEAVALYFARTTLLEYLEDPATAGDGLAPECNIAKILNEYFTTDCRSVEEFCAELPAEPEDRHDPRCEVDPVNSDNVRARRFTFSPDNLHFGFELPGPETPTATPGPCEDCAMAYCLDHYEIYYTRQVPIDTAPLEGGPFRAINGFAGLRIDNGVCIADECPYWYVDPVGGATPTDLPGTPTATETPGGATSTPEPTLPLEDESWRTRCPRPDGSCLTPAPTAEWCPTQQPLPTWEPVGTAPSVLNGCPYVSTPPAWPPPPTAIPVGSGTPTPGLPPTPAPTVIATLAPYATSEHATPCHTPTPTDTSTPTPTETDTPTPTLTPTNTLTPTITPTPLPTCESISDSRSVICPYSGCGGVGCDWGDIALTPPILECDPDGPYEFDVTVQKDGACASGGQVNVQIDGSGPFNSMTRISDTPPIWHISLCSATKPHTIRFRLVNNGGDDGRLTSYTVEYCCDGGCLFATTNLMNVQ